MRDYNAHEKVDWHDYYLEALSPVQTVSVKLGDWLFTPILALLHTIWFIAWFALGLDINLLTLIVSLEAIYITLFIGLGQKLQDKRAAIQARADKAEVAKAEAHREQLAQTQGKLLADRGGPSSGWVGPVRRGLNALAHLHPAVALPSKG